MPICPRWLILSAGVLAVLAILVCGRIQRAAARTGVRAAAVLPPVTRPIPPVPAPVVPAFPPVAAPAAPRPPATPAAAPRVQIIWKADLGHGVLGELENLSSVPLENVFVRCRYPQGVYRAGYYVGEEWVTSYPGQVIRYLDRQARREPGGGVLLYSDQSFVIPPGARGDFSVSNVSQFRVRDEYLEVYTADPLRPGRPVCRLAFTSTIEPL